MPEDNKPENTKKQDDSNDMLMGILAYLGILCLVPLLAAKDSKFAQYHAKQGVNLFALNVVLFVAQWTLGFMSIFAGLGFILIIFPLLWLAIVILSILGIVNVVNKKMEPLPIIGGIQLIK